MNVATACSYIGTQFWNQGRTQKKEIKRRVLHL